MKARRLAYGLFGLWAALAVAAVVLQGSLGDAFNAALAPVLAVLAGVGLLLWLRRPDNPIGPILLVLAVLITFSVAAEGTYRQWDGDPTPPLAVNVLVALDETFGLLWLTVIGILLPLLFPTGRLLSPRWRLVLWVAGIVVVLSMAGTALGPERLDWGTHGGIDNPLGVGGAAGSVLRAFKNGGEIVFLLLILTSFAGLGLRVRRSSGTERQQLKWIVLALGTALAGLIMAACGDTFGSEAIGNVGWSVFLAALIVGMPVAMGLAILRYRLYDIDLVIRRTLVYAVLTATLAVTYLGLVLLIGLAVGRSGFATAVSTLAVAALFRPLRARIQGVVDKRFYRRRYDAARELEAFGAHLRDELDLETLAADVRRVVQDTVQPAHVSLWLRSGR
jgi:hypothetical protein